MAGYSYFDHDRMILLGIEVHSGELELLQQAADEYDWKIIQSEAKPKLRKAAVDVPCDESVNMLNQNYK